MTVTEDTRRLHTCRIPTLMLLITVAACCGTGSSEAKGVMRERGSGQRSGNPYGITIAPSLDVRMLLRHESK